jgi:histidyl-tRNA synthetase
MRDVLPDEVALRDWAMAQILAVYRRHGFVRIETPAVESLRLLLRSDGGETEKLVFKILKRGEKLQTAGRPEDMADLGLRFDLTVPLVRYYAHNLARLPQPLKAIQIGPVWRAERPQQGRYRQFTQCDIDVLGVASEVADIELILATTEALAALGLKDLTVRLNDRRVLGAMVAHCGFDPARAGSVFIALDKLDKVGRDEVAAELREAGHAADAVDRLLALLGSATTPGALRGLLGPRADEGVWRGLQRIVDTVTAQAAGRFRLAFDATLVRGMGYYTGPIFEVQHGDSTSSIAGGGRYDRMVGKFIGREIGRASCRERV